ncbi:MAG: hypothetical protein H6949_04660 [Zoogloeaceae bacterium]|nr:hypothetical protein [Zoogloeaceae bacterium]
MRFREQLETSKHDSSDLVQHRSIAFARIRGVCDYFSASLAKIIGDGNIVGMEKRAHPMIELCGMPTGSMNAYEITEDGWYILNHGIVGRQGFSLCPTDTADNEVNIGHIISAFTSGNPIMIKELTGHPLRVYKTGDVITKDWRPDRVNFEINNKGIIVNVWFG